MRERDTGESERERELKRAAFYTVSPLDVISSQYWLVYNASRNTPLSSSVIKKKDLIYE